MSDEIRESRVESSSEKSDVMPDAGVSTSAEKNPAPTEDSNLTEATTSTQTPNNPLPSAPQTSGSSNALRRLIWLDERVKEARVQTFAAGQPGWAEYDAARQARDGVVQIGETGQTSFAVLLLERDAVALLVRAHVARAGLVVSDGPLLESDWEIARKVPAIQEAWNNLSAVQVANLITSTGAQGDQAIASLAAAQRKAFALGLHDFVTAIAEPLEFEANRLGRALFSRYTRVTLVAVAILAVIAMIGSWISAKFEKPNVALHRPVEVSSQYPGAGEDHSLLVDGDRTNLGFHTDCSGGWVIIDLGAPKNIEKVVVYNRSEYPERAVPLIIEVSNDHQNFRQVAEKREVFDKWAAKGLNAQGRYVKLRNTTSACFHLSEVEVY
jgi:hypothetical protein